MSSFDELIQGGTVVPLQRGSRLDDWWARVLGVGSRRRMWAWAGPIGVTILGGILRFYNLGYPHQLMFDETYYVKDAYTLGLHGYETQWPDNPNAAFEAGKVTTFLQSPEYVVHPPLGKWLIYLGMRLFGAQSSFGWRFSTALFGTLTILLLALIARSLFRSTMLGTIAGGLLAISGLGISMSRTALLDTFIMFFALAAFGTLLLDRAWHRRRLDRLLWAGSEHLSNPLLKFGPVVWWRPWLLATGVLLGATSSVKWSGIYFIAFFGLYAVIDDALARKALGIEQWFGGALLKQAPIAFVTLVPIAFVTYLSSWTGWLVTSGGWGRHWAEGVGNAATGFFAWVPKSLQSLWYYHQSAYQFHVGLTTPHSWSANPLTWPLMIRPTLFYRTQDFGDKANCSGDRCIATVSSIDNPILWWTAVVAVLVVLVLLARTKDWRYGVILMGVAAGYLPWLQYLNRTVFQFYTIAFYPFMLLAVVAVLERILGSREALRFDRNRGVAITAVYLGVVTLVSAYFYPLWIGVNIPYWLWSLHSWLPFTWQ